MRKHTSIETEYSRFREESTYQTGAAKPRRRQNVLITLLLMLVIFLGGICSALGVMNIRLLSALYSEQKNIQTLSVENADDGVAQVDIAVREMDIALQDDEILQRRLGIRVQQINELHRSYWGVSEGLAIEQTYGKHNELQAGDILLSVNGEALTEVSQLVRALDATPCGGRLELEVLSGRQKFTLELEIIDP